MAGSKRERDLARAKYERQQAKREATAARRRRRLQTTTAVVVGALVVLGVVMLSRWMSSGDKSNAASTTFPTPSATPSASSSAIPTDGSAASCTYTHTPGTGSRAALPGTSAPTRPATSKVNIVLNGKPVTVQLLRAKAPCTVNSFTSLARQGYFNGTPCHRLTKGGLSVLQCGDPTGKGTGGPGYTFADENLAGATYKAGTVAMANSGPNTNGSQFFIVYANSTLPPSYTPFGQVVGGMPVVEAIAAQGVAGGGSDGAPAKKVVIDRVVPAG